MAVTFSVIKNKYSGHITLKFPSSHPSPVFNFFYFLPIILCQGVAKILLRTVYCAVHLTCRQKEVLIRDNLLFCKKIFLNGIKKKKSDTGEIFFKNILDLFLQSRTYHFGNGKLYLSVSWIGNVILILTSGGHCDSDSTLDKPFSVGSV